MHTSFFTFLKNIFCENFKCHMTQVSYLSIFFMNCSYPAVSKLTCLPCLMSEQLKYLAHCVPIKVKDKLVHFRVVYFLGLINSMNYLLPSIRW